MTYAELIAEQDKQRTQRNFVSFLSGAFGVDQSLANEDGDSTNRTGNYQSLAPYGVGGVSIEGRPISNIQGTATTGGIVMTWPLIAMLAGFAYLLTKKA